MNESSALKPELLSVLACPRCDSRPALRLEGEELVCSLCATRYPIVNGIPHLIPPELSSENHGHQ
ncbi:MAG: hypothetical protein JNJ45_00895 [Chthonomonas sp.]|nr:hypothetical protein [Chthonomonas sp.]